MNTIPIKTKYDFECVADDMISDFMIELDPKFIREPTKEDDEAFGFEIGFMYSDEAMKLYHSYCSKLKKLGEKLFPGETLEIKGSAVIFP